jgi:prepilin-type processing-associated H-X9-DG protein
MSGWANPPGWAVVVYPYVKNMQIYQCPDMVNSGTQSYNPGFPRSYGINGLSSNICGNAPSTYYGAGCASNAQIPKPAETIALSEGLTDWAIYWDQSAAYITSSKQLWPVHSGVGNYGFCDGHAKALKPTATNLGQNMWTIEDDGPCTGQNMPAALAAIEAAYPGG